MRNKFREPSSDNIEAAVGAGVLGCFGGSILLMLLALLVKLAIIVFLIWAIYRLVIHFT